MSTSTFPTAALSDSPDRLSVLPGTRNILYFHNFRQHIKRRLTFAKETHEDLRSHGSLKVERHNQDSVRAAASRKQANSSLDKTNSFIELDRLAIKFLNFKPNFF
jgi:hypothetical protein